MLHFVYFFSTLRLECFAFGDEIYFSSFADAFAIE